MVLFAFTALLLLSTENKKFKTSVIEHRVETNSCMYACSCVREVSSSDDVIRTSTMSDTILESRE